MLARRGSGHQDGSPHFISSAVGLAMAECADIAAAFSVSLTRSRVQPWTQVVTVPSGHLYRAPSMSLSAGFHLCCKCDVRLQGLKQGTKKIQRPSREKSTSATGGRGYMAAQEEGRLGKASV